MAWPKKRPDVAARNALNRGAANANWKGDEVSYTGLHHWVRQELPRPEMCECGERKTREVCNLDGKYSRDLKTWKWMCRSCHLRMDDVANKAWKTKRNRKPGETDRS